jgi:fermentation-respiration switch protein FrsA (DUF1100 family)
VLSALPARAQTPSAAGDPFAAGRWHFEVEGLAAVEAWNYNISHEELYGLSEAVTYGMRDGLVLRATQRLAYVSQRAEDAVLLGLTIGVRGRVYRLGRVSAFLQGDIGISHTAIATPPRGTRFNYLAAGGAGVTVRAAPRLHFVATLQLIHVSNAGVKGPGRNPDIEAIGPAIGIIMAF